MTYKDCIIFVILGVCFLLFFDCVNGGRPDTIPTTPYSSSASRSHQSKAPSTRKPALTAPSAPSSRKKSSYSPSKSDPYNVSDYAHADDFYYDHRDDFFDYEDAEDYYDSHSD